MKRYIMLFAALAMMVSYTSCKKAEKKHKAHGKMLPTFSLADPAGYPHKSAELFKNGLVMVVTAPTLSNEGAQKGWDKYLTPLMKKEKIQLVFLEDMQPSAFKNTALNDMKKDFKPGEPPLLLIDHSGSVRERLGAEKGKTEVLVYNKNGELVFSDKDKPSAQGAQTILSKVKQH